jgi:hypothetical protein
VRTQSIKYNGSEVGYTGSNRFSINLSGVTCPAPEAVYQTARMAGELHTLPLGEVEEALPPGFLNLALDKGDLLFEAEALGGNWGLACAACVMLYVMSGN